MDSSFPYPLHQEDFYHSQYPSSVDLVESSESGSESPLLQQRVASPTWQGGHDAEGRAVVAKRRGCEVRPVPRARGLERESEGVRPSERQRASSRQRGSRSRSISRSRGRREEGDARLSRPLGLAPSTALPDHCPRSPGRDGLSASSGLEVSPRRRERRREHHSPSSSDSDRGYTLFKKRPEEALQTTSFGGEGKDSLEDFRDFRRDFFTWVERYKVSRVQAEEGLTVCLKGKALVFYGQVLRACEAERPGRVPHADVLPLAKVRFGAFCWAGRSLRGLRAGNAGGGNAGERGVQVGWFLAVGRPAGPSGRG